METNAQQLENVIQSNISVLLGEYGWMFLAALVVLFFKTTIESVLAGLLIFVGNDYNNDDIIILDGRPGRIVRVSMWKTTFNGHPLLSSEHLLLFASQPQLK